jgi:hypothetical protein
MAYGVPVVTTSEGVEGIDYQNGRELPKPTRNWPTTPAACWKTLLNESKCAWPDERSSRNVIRRPVVDKMIAVYGQLQALSNGNPHPFAEDFK